MFLYLLILIVCIILSNIAIRRNNKKYVFFIILILSLVSGLRGENVGIDTGHYIDRWNDVVVGNDVYMEYGYSLLMKTVHFFTNDWSYLFLICAGLTCGLIIIRLWELRDLSSFPIMVTAFYALYFLRTMNVTRQFLAIAIVFYFSRFFFKERYLLFLIGVFVASFFHISSVMALAMFALLFIKWEQLSVSYKTVLIIGVLCFPILFSLAIKVVNAEYGVYFLNQENNFGVMTIIKFLFLILTCVLSHLLKYRKNSTDSIVDSQSYQIICVIYIYAAALFLQSLGYIFPFMDRIGLLFNMFGVVYWGILFKTKCISNKVFYFGMFLLLVFHPFIMTLLIDSYGVIPYSISW